MKLVKRNTYIDTLERWQDKAVIKVITGVRRCGKSTLMQMFQDRLLEQGIEKERIIAVNLEDFDFLELSDPKKLHAYIKSNMKEDGMNYVFIDEIQQCENFQRVVDSLFLRRNIDLYVTGSNSRMLSGELATLLSGRYVEIRVFPLSFKEYVDWTGEKNNLSQKYRDYIENTSFPFGLELWNEKKQLFEYLEGVYTTIVLKDVAQRYQLIDPMRLESVTKFLFDNIGNPLSIKKIADTLTSDGRKIDPKVVERYLRALVESFVLYPCRRYNIHGKELLKTYEKYYVVDIGMRRMLLGSRITDIGHILENVVFLELLRRYREVYVGKIYDLEIDFVVRDETGLQYIQVAATVRDKYTLQKELAPLLKIKDSYPKILLTLDMDPDAEYEGIKKYNALEWLVE